MSTTTVDLNRRLSVLEARIGITAAGDDNSNNNNHNVNERLLQLRLNYERKIAAGVVANLNNSTTSLLSSTNTNNNKELWLECLKLLKELDPDIGLTHQQQPLLYKRQQILASSTDMKNDFHQLDIILNLLLKDTRVGYCGYSGNSGSDVISSSNNDSAFKGNITAVTDNDNDTTAKAAGQSSSSEQQKQQQNKLKQKQQDEEQQRQQRGGNILRLDQVLQAPIVSSDYYTTTNINPTELKRLETLRVKLLDLNNRSTTLSQQLRHTLECYHTAMQAVSNKIVLADEKIRSSR